MNLAAWLYITDLLNNLDGIFILCVIFYFAALLIGGICTVEGESSFAKKVISKWWIVFLICLFSCFIPSKKTMYLMLGAQYLQNATLPSKVEKILELKLDDIIADFDKAKKNIDDEK